MNFIQIAGHLGADPEERFTQGGKKVTTMRVATKSRKGGQDVTIWWRVTIWDDQFKNMLPHLKKGSALMAFGEVQKPEIYNDREGKPQISLELTAVHLQFSPFGKPGGASPQDGRSSSGSNGASFGQYPEASSSPYQGGSGSMQPQGATFDDEVPF